jgi:hypothetical protein
MDQSQTSFTMYTIPVIVYAGRRRATGLWCVQGCALAQLKDSQWGESAAGYAAVEAGRPLPDVLRRAWRLLVLVHETRSDARRIPGVLSHARAWLGHHLATVRPAPLSQERD